MDELSFFPDVKTAEQKEYKIEHHQTQRAFVIMHLSEYTHMHACIRTYAHTHAIRSQTTPS